jgi:hypothetical protein
MAVHQWYQAEALGIDQHRPLGGHERLQLLAAHRTHGDPVTGAIVPPSQHDQTVQV